MFIKQTKMLPGAFRGLGSCPTTLRGFAGLGTDMTGSAGNSGSAGATAGAGFAQVAAGLYQTYESGRIQRAAIKADKTVGLAAQTTAIALGQAEAERSQAVNLAWAQNAAWIALAGGVGLGVLFAGKALVSMYAPKKRSA